MGGRDFRRSENPLDAAGVVYLGSGVSSVSAHTARPPPALNQQPRPFSKAHRPPTACYGSNHPQTPSPK